MRWKSRNQTITEVMRTECSKELDHQDLRQVEFPQLSQEEHPLLCSSGNGVSVPFAPKVPGYNGAKEVEST